MSSLNVCKGLSYSVYEFPFYDDKAVISVVKDHGYAAVLHGNGVIFM